MFLFCMYLLACKVFSVTSLDQIIFANLLNSKIKVQFQLIQPECNPIMFNLSQTEILGIINQKLIRTFPKKSSRSQQITLT